MMVPVMRAILNPLTELVVKKEIVQIRLEGVGGRESGSPMLYADQKQE